MFLISLSACSFAFNTTAGRTVPLAATRIYQLSFFTGFGVSAITYWFLNVLFPAAGASEHWKEIDVSDDEITIDGPASDEDRNSTVDEKDRVLEYTVQQ